MEEVAFVTNQDLEDFWKIETDGSEERSVSVAVLELQQAAWIQAIIAEDFAVLAKIWDKMNMVVGDGMHQSTSTLLVTYAEIAFELCVDLQKCQVALNRCFNKICLSVWLDILLVVLIILMKPIFAPSWLLLFKPMRNKQILALFMFMMVDLRKCPLICIGTRYRKIQKALFSRFCYPVQIIAFALFWALLLKSLCRLLSILNKLGLK